MKTTIILLAILLSTSISGVKAGNLIETTQQQITILQTSAGTQFTVKIDFRHLAKLDRKSLNTKLEETAKVLGFPCVIKENSQIEMQISGTFTYTVKGLLTTEDACKELTKKDEDEN